MKKKKGATHGGVREGAGAKPHGSGPKVTVATRVSPEVRAFLDTTESIAETIDQAVRATAGFKAFMADRTK